LKKVVVVLFSIAFIVIFAAGCGSSFTSTNNGETKSSKVNEVAQSTERESESSKVNEVVQSTKEETAIEKEYMTASTEAVQEQTGAIKKSAEDVAAPIQNVVDTGVNTSHNQDSNPAINKDIKASDIHLTLGSSKSDVIKSLGEPYSIVPYGSTSFLYMYSLNGKVPKINNTIQLYLFEGNPFIVMDGTEIDQHIIGWNDSEGVLKISIGEKIASPKPITLGSSIHEVVEAAGTPPFYAVSSVSIELRYNHSDYFLTDLNGNVKGWTNTGICTTNIEMDPSAPPVKVGSTCEEVGRAMGAPISMSSDRWEYDKGRIIFNVSTGLVKSWIVYSPGLKVE